MNIDFNKFEKLIRKKLKKLRGALLLLLLVKTPDLDRIYDICKNMELF